MSVHLERKFRVNQIVEATSRRGKLERVALQPRLALVQQLGREAFTELSHALGIEMPVEGWRAGVLGRQTDRLERHQEGHHPTTLIEHYATEDTTGLKGRHARVYGPVVTDREGPHVPIIIVGDQDAMQSLQRREPHLQVHQLNGHVEWSGTTIPTEQLAQMGVLDPLRGGRRDSVSPLWWAYRKASFQLVGVVKVVKGDRTLEMRVCKDVVNNSGYSVLVWSDDDKPLGTDSTGKAVWGVNITNSPNHRPGGNWVTLEDLES